MSPRTIPVHAMPMHATRGRGPRARLVAMILLATAVQLACGPTPEIALPQAPQAPWTQSSQAAQSPLPAAHAAPGCANGAAAPDLAMAVEALLEDAEAIPSLRAVVVARGGVVLAERGYDGARPDTPANIKSASKTVMSALVGIAIDKGLLEGVDQPVAPLLRSDLPPQPDPRLERVTIGHLLSMQAGMERTSGPYYGRWVTSDNWVRDALARPFVDEPGGGMLYSTGSTHLLSAVLARASGRPVRELAREWLGPQAGFVIASWDRDPQGIHFGGNNMAMDTRSLLAFGELYRSGGVSRDGRRLLSQAWIDASWQPRTRSRFTGDGYGYGWFLRDIAGEPVRYAWGYGGQMLYVVPSLDLVMAMTSDDGVASARSGHRDALHALAGALIQAAGCSP